MSFANTTSPVASTSKKANRTGNENCINSRWVFASLNSQDGKTHRPTLSLRWCKTDTL